MSCANFLQLRPSVAPANRDLQGKDASSDDKYRLAQAAHCPDSNRGLRQPVTL
jgi:hypothetical protein